MRQSRRMAKARVTKDGWRCDRCGYEWIPRKMTTTPTVCPKCKSPYWNKPRKTAKPER